jgi:RNA polymerase sigma-70 factor (ECF subfamily)
LESALVQEAVTHARDGDREALHFLYVRFAGVVEEAVRSNGAGPERAEQLTAEMFAGLTPRIAGYEPLREPFGDWLVRVAGPSPERRAA